MSESQGRSPPGKNFDGRNTFFVNDANALDDAGRTEILRGGSEQAGLSG